MDFSLLNYDHLPKKNWGRQQTKKEHFIVLLLANLFSKLCLLLVLTIIKTVQILSYTSPDFMLSSEEDPGYLTLYNMYPVPYDKIPIDKTLECDFLHFESFLSWETVTSASTYLKFTLAPSTEITWFLIWWAQIFIVNSIRQCFSFFSWIIWLHPINRESCIKTLFKVLQYFRFIGKSNFGATSENISAICLFLLH